MIEREPFMNNLKILVVEKLEFQNYKFKLVLSDSISFNKC